MTTGTDGPPPPLAGADTRFLAGLAQQLRADAIRCSTAAGSGRPTSAMSAADLMAVLLARHLRYWDNPADPGNDHLIFSKGHASPLLYAMFKAAGLITDEELVTGFRRLGSRLQGHPTACCPGWTSRPGRSGRACPTASGSPWPDGTWTGSPTRCGCYAGTARWPRDPCGRRWRRPPTISSATSPRSST